jgi:hypothetical protein
MSNIAPTIEQQTGWRRPYPNMICDDGDALARVTQFSFDLDDFEFVAYFIRRTGYNILEADCGWEECKRSIHDLTLDDTWRKIERGKLQDCWELYRTHGNG